MADALYRNNEYLALVEGLEQRAEKAEADLAEAVKLLRRALMLSGQTAWHGIPGVLWPSIQAFLDRQSKP